MHLDSCPLTPTLRELLQASVLLGSMRAAVPARAVQRSPHTVNAELSAIRRALGVKSTYAAALVCLRRGWIVLPADAPIEARPPRPGTDRTEK